MAGSNALDFQIFRGILLGSVSAKFSLKIYCVTHSCEFEDFSGEIFEDGGNVNGCLGSNSHLVLCVVLQETLDTAAREL